MAKYEYVPLQFHPRAFSAFGRDLVTNDTVAVAELVKNCYDAFAHNVTVKITSDQIQIIDDGLGMTEDIIRNSWAVVATPNKKANPTVERDGKIRRVSGNKGLGRFSAARLGRRINIITKSSGSPIVEAEIDWERLFETVNISECSLILNIDDECTRSDITESGTIIIITGLYETWDDNKITELQNSLARLISPFDQVNDFSIKLIYEGYEEPVEIKPQDFINHPTYTIKGLVDDTGLINWYYIFAPQKSKTIKKDGIISWQDAHNGFHSAHVFDDEHIDSYKAGSFSFEIRAWDLDKDSVADVSDAFNISKNEIRRNISQYKGLSVYRDNVLVLPKSDATKDWLGMDVRRVSRIGKRLSTSQIVGIIDISSEANPEVKDTTDREKLVDTVEYNQFCRIVETIISTLEDLRQTNKTPTEKGPQSLSDLLGPISAKEVADRLEEEAERGTEPEKLVGIVREYAEETERKLQELNERLTYYAQTASLGSVAIVILHEILTGMGIIYRFISRIRDMNYSLDAKTEEYLRDAENSHKRLIEVANSFAPLYKRSLRKQANRCKISEEITNSIRLVSAKKAAKKIVFVEDVRTDGYVPLFSGELQTILINLLDNAVYWTEYSKKKEKKILVRAEKTEKNHYLITVSDTGCGVLKEDAEKIFQPGITAKPHGIGMGLVIVTELLKYYDCKIAIVIPGEMCGATFQFDLPIVKEKENEGTNS